MYVNNAYVFDLQEFSQEFQKLSFTIMDFLGIEQVNTLTNSVSKGNIMYDNEIINGSNYPYKLIFNGTTTIAIWGRDCCQASKTIAKCSDPCWLLRTGVEICIVRRIFRKNVLNRLRHRNPYNWVDAAWDILYATNAIDQKKYNSWINRVRDIYNLVVDYKNLIGEDEHRNIAIEFDTDGKILDYTHRNDIKRFKKCYN